MPELPEVETVARQLAAQITGQRVRTVELLDRKLGPLSPRLLRGRAVRRVFRLGKQVLLELRRERGAPVWLAVHLRMTGRLVWSPAPEQRHDRHLRARLELERGWLLFCDARRFGTLRLLRQLELARPAGQDPTDPCFTPPRLARLLGQGKQALKVWLLRQDRLVGLGNIYASEILYHARLHPARAAGSLTRAEVGRLHSAITTVLARAIEHCGTTFSDFQTAEGLTGSYQQYLAVYARQGQPCPGCGRPVRRLVQQQRSTFYCPCCQRARRGRTTGSLTDPVM